MGNQKFELQAGALFRGKSRPGWALLAGTKGLRIALSLSVLLASPNALAWTLSDLNPWKQIREYRIFSLTRANPIGVRVMVVPVIDDPVNAMIVTRLCGEFANSLRSFASEVWMLTDLPENPLKAGFYTAIPSILADYRMKNCLSMNLLKQMIPEFECDYIALFEVTDYDRYWVDEDLQHRVGVRAVFYDYESGDPRIEKFYQGARGRRLEEGAFNEAERIAIKGLVGELEHPLRKAVKERQAELERRYEEVQIIAGNVGMKEFAIHQYDLMRIQAEILKNQELARKARAECEGQARETEYWKFQAEQNKSRLDEMNGKSSSPSSNSANPSQTPQQPIRLMPFKPTPPQSSGLEQEPASIPPLTATTWDPSPSHQSQKTQPVVGPLPSKPTGEDPWAPLEVEGLPSR